MLKRCLTLVGLVYTLSLFNISDAAAKICFLPDSSCGTGKISSVKPNPAQCLYSSMAQAQNGMSSCEKAYKQNFCFYRRCKTREEDKNVFSNYSDCQKALEDNQTCQSCGGCYKIVTNANQTPNNKTCNETEATCSAKGKAFEANGEYDSNNVACGSCKVIEICPSGYSTAYQSQKDCKTGETFSSNGTANGKVCGKCTTETTCPSNYTSSKKCATDKGFTLFEHPNYSGCYQCQCRNEGQINGKCTNCQAEGYTQTQTSGYVCTDACPINSKLFKPGSCTSTATCPSGYSSDKTSISSCGVQGPLGWNFESKTVGGITCGKCTAKACPAGYDTSKKSCPYPGSTTVGGYSGNTACTKCTNTTSCPSGAYATQNECQKHVPTLKCFNSTYTGACKKGSISGCWKPFQTVRSHIMMSCSGGTCQVGYCLPTNSSNSGYYGSACVKIPNLNTTRWESSTSGFNYTGAGIVSCSITTTRMSGENCAGTYASASSICQAKKELGKSPYELDDGKW